MWTVQLFRVTYFLSPSLMMLYSYTHLSSFFFKFSVSPGLPLSLLFHYGNAKCKGVSRPRLTQIPTSSEMMCP